MDSFNTSQISNIILGNLSIDILDLYHLLEHTELSDAAHEHAFLEMHMILDGYADLIIDGEVLRVEKNIH